MNRRIAPDELSRLRNHLPIREVLYLLRVPWKQDNELCRFLCPICKGWHTSVHPSQNLGRCFDCSKNFNPIDLVCAQKHVAFRMAVGWLRTVESLQKDTGYGSLISALRAQTLHR